MKEIQKKKEDFSRFIVHELSRSILKKLMVEVKLTRDNDVYPSNGF